MSVAGKIYEVTDIDFSHFMIQAKETDLRIDDVPESELWDISDLEEYRIRLVNSGGIGEMIDMAEWVEKHKRA